PDCATSGCSIPAVWCELDHVSWWSRGGPTDIANGINLCNYHHHEVHNKNLEVIRDPESERWKAVRVIRR
ncbi:HNH endonuclease, partial [Agrococcus casei]|uniref:HNH endonuclease n=1 Tax=Agrococcus casei TaxID=343512 RepID=UPI003F938E0E